MTLSFIINFFFLQMWVITLQNRPPGFLFIVFEFELVKMLSTINFIQIVFCSFLIKLRFNSLHQIENMIKNTPKSKLDSFSKDFYEFYNATSALTNVFNRCFGWSIFAEIVKDFVFVADGWYTLFTKKISLNEAFYVYTLWTHIIYIVVICVICERIHSEVRLYLNVVKVSSTIVSTSNFH